MRFETILMSGLSFCLGLLLGLVVQLPGVRSPVEQTINGRSRRHILSDAYRDIVDLESEPASPRGPISFQNNVNNVVPDERTLGTLGHSGAIRRSEERTNDKTNTKGVAGKQSEKDNKFSKHISVENPSAVLQKGIHVKRIQTEEDIETATISLANHARQTAASGERIHGATETEIYKHSFMPQSNKSRNLINTANADNEVRDLYTGTRETADLNNPSKLLKFQNGHQKQARLEHTGPVDNNVSDWFRGIYFSNKLDMFIPGFTNTEIKHWREKSTRDKVVSITEGCGRMQNRKITFIDGTPACARYRINTDQMQGEIYSYYLSLLLGIRNVPPSVVLNADPRDAQWVGVGADIMRAQWNTNKPLIVTPWVQGLEAAFIPRELRREPRKLHPTPSILKGRNTSDIIELAQWSDLIVLDYLTANVDRLVNNMFNLQWNNDMMDNPTHNLARQSSLLVFLDNESGLFHSYRLLDKYAQYHESLIKGLCIFRPSTAQNVKRLHENNSVKEELYSLFKDSEPLHQNIPKIPQKNLNILTSRVAAVYKQILHCEHLYRTP